MRAPFVAWPGWPHVRLFLALAVPVTLWFLIVYGGCDYVTGFRSRHRVHYDFELAMPFVPSSVVVYDSVYPVMWLAPFVLRTRPELIAYAVAQVVIVAAAGIGFLLHPAELGFPPTPDAGIWAPMVSATKAASLRYNLAPSLHVALAVITTAVYVSRTSASIQIALWFWAVLVAASTLLLHQHHLIDVMTGWFLGLVGGWGYHRFMARRHLASPASRPEPSA